MRSLAFTLVLGLLAVAACVLARWQWAGGNLDDLLGPPPVPIGHRIYDSFSPSEVKHIRVAQNGVVAMFKLGDRGWEAVSPWKDRMDPRAAVGIINFALGMRVEDYAPADDIDPQAAGLADSRIDIRLDDKDQKQLARFKVGRRTPWLATFPDSDALVPTVFVQRRDENQKRYIYACTSGDITPLLKDAMSRLRDHHPFYFNPLALKTIHIRTPQWELTLDRPTDKSPWRVTMPLELATDKKAVTSLLEGLYQLEAVKVSDNTVPAGSPQTKAGFIAITPFGSLTETVLEFQAPESPTSSTVLATISDRPNTVFELPLKTGTEGVSLSDLLQPVNKLRDAMLTNISKENIELLRRIVIHPASGAEIELTRTPPKRWMVTIAGETQQANEERLYTLLKTATDSRVTGFPSDAATDFTPWGLDRPILNLSFLTENEKQAIHLNFGTDGKGNYFANRQGTSTVMRVDSSLLSSIPMKAFEWRQDRIWSIDRTNLLAISRRVPNEPPLALLYDFNREQWTASKDATDVTSILNPSRANYLLGILEGLKVTRWLSPDDISAEQALLRPSLGFKILENTLDATGEQSGRATRELLLAPASAGPKPAFYYGRAGSDDQPFMLDSETYSKLATELLEQE